MNASNERAVPVRAHRSANILVRAALAALCVAAFAPPLAAQGLVRPLPPGVSPQPPPPPIQVCFLLADTDGIELRRQPANGCDRRVSPGATYEIAAALAGLDASVVRNSGRVSGGERLDQALAYSSSGYFRDLDREMGSARMGEYLSRFNYGNADTRSGGEYWNGGSLQISPNEQMRFLQRLFDNQLPVSRQAVAGVRESLQPQGFIVASRGRVIARSGSMSGGEPPMVKTGEVDTGAESVRWQVGTLTRGSRTFIYVSCVTGPLGLAQNAAAIVADHELRNAGVQ
ncbi:hypothetical protein A7A76_19965 [Lysobacter enzymogenes]|uniref:penicillin-binding transpeptidase domain-containing protein n=1 Tax=Lysobacter enzymogenes TaxID=69 RepID=UPI0019D0938E|nr:penicillin-binding transpeptidase domain-containing protein [Lysobacter enzymogenes]MBN7137017.1 hypothetical protein [Lysobacter enzymogenes]